MATQVLCKYASFQQIPTMSRFPLPQIACLEHVALSFFFLLTLSSPIANNPIVLLSLLYRQTRKLTRILGCSSTPNWFHASSVVHPYPIGFTHPWLFIHTQLVSRILGCSSTPSWFHASLVVHPHPIGFTHPWLFIHTQLVSRTQLVGEETCV